MNVAHAAPGGAKRTGTGCFFSPRSETTTTTTSQNAFLLFPLLFLSPFGNDTRRGIDCPAASEWLDVPPPPPPPPSCLFYSFGASLSSRTSSRRPPAPHVSLWSGGSVASAGCFRDWCWGRGGGVGGGAGSVTEIHLSEARRSYGAERRSWKAFYRLFLFSLVWCKETL